MAGASVTWSLTWHDRLRSRLQRQPWGLAANLVVVALFAAHTVEATVIGVPFLGGIEATFALGILAFVVLSIRGGSRAEVTAVVDDEGLELASSEVVSRIAWTDDLTHTDLPDYLMLCLHGRCVALIPKDTFDASGLARFLGVVRAHTEEEWPPVVDPRDVVTVVILLGGLVYLLLSSR